MNASQGSPKRVLFVEGRNLDTLRAFAANCGRSHRLLHRPEQDLYLLEISDADAALEQEAGALEGCRAWAFNVIEG